MDKHACGHGEGDGLTEPALKAALLRAEARAIEGGQRWTPPRHRVYELLLRAGGPVKAYDLMEIYGEGRVAKPPTVYRALDFLEHRGLVHRIASLNAFVACDGDDPDHAAAFLICDCCGSADEFKPGPIRTASRAALERSFQARAFALEVRGRCRRCSLDSKPNAMDSELVK